MTCILHHKCTVSSFSPKSATKYYHVIDLTTRGGGGEVEIILHLLSANSHGFTSQVEANRLNKHLSVNYSHCKYQSIT